jgi:hypothetical protein
MYATIAGPPKAAHPNRRNDVNSRHNDAVAGVVVEQDGSLVVAPAFIFSSRATAEARQVL